VDHVLHACITGTGGRQPKQKPLSHRLLSTSSDVGLIMLTNLCFLPLIVTVPTHDYYITDTGADAAGVGVYS